MRFFAKSFTCAMTLTLLIVSASSAEKGGKGKPGGGGGGEDPPSILTPVRYSVQPIEIPGTGMYFNNHNDAGAMVGWTLYETTGSGIRAIRRSPFSR